jgi:putative transcription factor
MECELCGKEIQNPRKISVEGSILNVCENCVKYGEEVQFSKPSVAVSPSQTNSYKPPGRKVGIPYSSDVSDDYELVEEYGKIIQKAWQQSGKKLEEFAAMLNEKSSVISKLISGSAHPDEKLIRKLEKKLNIKLREAIDA